MSGRDLKDLRKQLRNVVQEILPALLTNELVAAVQKKLTEDQTKELTDRLDRIEGNVTATLKKQDERARAVQSFLVQGAVKEINDYLHNTNITMTAWEEIMVEKIGNIEEFNAQIDERKKAVAARIKAEREKQMADRIKATQMPTAEEQKPKEESVPAPAAEQPSAEAAE